MSRRMNPLDASWLFIDSAQTPMHVGVMAIFSLPADAGPDFIRDLFAHLRTPAGFSAPFNLRLRPSRLGLPRGLLPAWQTDRNVDLDYHLRHSALPQPGGERELGVLVSRLHSHPLDFAKPLWECHVIEGLSGGRFALYMKMHHSLVDGVGGMRLLGRLLSPDPAVRNLAPPWSVGSGEGRRRGLASPATDWQKLFDETRERARHLPQMGQAITETWTDALQNRHPEIGAPFRAPRSILNRKVSAQRRFATQHYALSRIRAIAKAAEVSINDVFLAICSGALRRYLDELGSLPDEPLTAGLPVSVRTADDAGGNAISFIIANLHTLIEDPLERLIAIRESTRQAKQRFKSLPRDVITGYTALFMAPFMLQLLTGLGGLMRPMFNITISNVPGPLHPLYFNGALMDQIYPVSLLSHGQALNITVVTYAGQFNVGYTGCREALPHVQRLSVYTGEALEELERLLEITASPRKPRRKSQPV